ncbi:MAG: LptA/OstA family protein [Candidatus Omnitrophota bacterium]
MKNIFIIAAVILSFAVTGCGKREAVAQAVETVKPAAGVSSDSPAAPGESAATTDQVKHAVTAFDLEGLADDGSKKWDVKGQSAESLSEDEVRINNITAATYGKDSNATITADTGLYTKSKNNVRLEQNVKAVIENTPKSSGDIIALPLVVESSPKTERPPRAADKSRMTKTIITCDAEVEFNYEKGEGYFNKNVHVINDEGTIDADKITVYLDPETKTVKTIVCEGSVKIQRGENMTFSEKATYLATEKKIILAGQPKLVLYQEGKAQDDFLSLDKK